MPVAVRTLFFTGRGRQCVGICIIPLARMNRAWRVGHVQVDVDDVSFLVRPSTRDRPVVTRQSVNQSTAKKIWKENPWHIPPLIIRMFLWYF